MSNEILTLQFGHYSNFVGTHWWNIQESSFTYDPDHPTDINHDVLYREGLNLKGEVTFTPRLLLVDLKGSLKTLPEEGELYQLPQDLDTAGLEVRAQKPEEKLDFLKDLQEGGCHGKSYDLESEVRVWSDFLYTRFHPRSVNVVNEYQHSSESDPFDIFPLGANLWKSEQWGEDFADKIRNYVEECNNFQGFHVLLDSWNGFSGLSVACLEYLRDEYTPKSIFGVPLNPEVSKNPLHLLSTALCFEGLSEHASLFTPLSAVLAATLDTVTLNHRLKGSPHSLVDLCSDFSTNGRKAAATSCRFPFPIKQNEDLIDCLDEWKGPLSLSLTPNCEIESDNSLQLVTLRGIPESQLKRPSHVAERQRDMPAYRCETVKEMLEFYLLCTCFGTKSEVAVTGEKMAVRTPFPRFFGQEESVSVWGGLHSGKFVGRVFGALSEDLEKVKYKRFHQFVSEGVENDQLKECFDKILDLRDCYEDSYLI